MSSPVRIASPVKTAATLAAVLALGAATVIPAGAAPPPAPPPPGATAVDSAKSGRVTLITGDVVEIADAGGGRKTASVRPAAGRERITFQTIEADGGLRILPSDVVPFVTDGLLDADLFDVDELLADGFADTSRSSLPLIVKYADPGAGGVRALSGTTTVRQLDSIGGAAIKAEKSELPAFWSALAPKPGARGATTVGAGISKIWLDGRVKAVLDKSVAQIGAPAAWQAGYEGAGVKVAVLDTGADATHPDLSGRIEQSEDFSGSQTGTKDAFGHGTHVASTIAGSGAGAGGSRKGVAPKADLLVGKVLGDDGSGFESWIISGMEWAAEQGAAVVNMSLGGTGTDGTDPMSAAVDRITAESGTLFVVSAGNDGADSSIGTPGTASSALTVGAVDRADQIADFSSRGPRRGDEALKPEISAPGVGIVAARAAGTAMGSPLDDHYTAASGTSMAAPHVAGAAALLKQAHPQWSPARLKDALVSTTKSDPALSVYAQGAGRVDVARAVSQRVHATGIADFKLVSGDAGTTRRITYTNDGTSPVTLSLALTVKNLVTTQAETDAFGVPASVTVPAGGTADVTVTLDPRKLDRGLHSGHVVATGTDGSTVRTAVGALREGPRHKVTVRAIDLNGKPTGVPMFSLFSDNPNSGIIWYIHKDAAPRTFELEEGTYLLHGLVEHNDPQDEKASLYTDPLVKITGETEIVLDARKAVPIKIETPKPAQQQGVLSYYVHREFANGRKVSHGVMHFSTVEEVRVTPTQQVPDGKFEFSSRWQLVAPMVQATVPGVGALQDMHLLHQSPAFDGKRRFPLVYAKPGASANVRGAVVVAESSEDGWGGGSEQDQIKAAAEAGAAGIILVRPPDFSPWTVWRPVGDREPIPAMTTTTATGKGLISRAQQRGATIDLTLTTSSPYLYDVQQVLTGAIPKQLVHRVTPQNSARVDTHYVDNGGFQWAKEQRFGWRPWQEFSWNDAQRFVQTPKHREEWVSAGDSLWQHRVSHVYGWNDMGPLLGGAAEAPRSYRAGRSSQTWFGTVVRPASPRGVPALVSTRTADRLSLRIPEYVDQGGHYSVHEADEVAAKLWRDGELVAELPNALQDLTTTSADAAYRLELTTKREGEEWVHGTNTRTVWDFRSAKQPADRANPLALLQVDYQVPADSYGKVSARPHVVGFTVRHQDGFPAPRSTSLQAEVSFDEGKSWRRIVAVGAKGRYVAVVPAGKGSVSLRVVAGDGLGNKVTQTVIKAYGLK